MTLLDNNKSLSVRLVQEEAVVILLWLYWFSFIYISRSSVLYIDLVLFMHCISRSSVLYIDLSFIYISGSSVLYIALSFIYISGSSVLYWFSFIYISRSSVLYIDLSFIYISGSSVLYIDANHERMSFQWQKLSPTEFHQLQEYISCKLVLHYVYSQGVSV